MLISFLKKFRRDRRGATALIVALMTVPLIISAGAAVDFSRVSSARAQMQLAVDAAALAGVGSYQNAGGQTVGNGNSQTTLADAGSAINVAKGNFAAFTNNLNSYVALSAPNVTAGCSSANAAQCGPTPSTLVCPQNAGYYCVKVTDTGVLKTSLLGIVIPNVTLSVNSEATTPIPTLPVGGGNFPTKNIPNAYDRNATYAYGVPLDASGNPQFDQLPPVSSGCTGPILNVKTLVSGTCLYYQIGDSASQTIPSQATLHLVTNASGQVIQPIAFTFVNFTGGYHTYGYRQQPDSGYCPDYTLYGSISQVPGGYVPAQDSLNIYSSAYMAVGEPPTYNANHPIVPFQIPAGVGGNTKVENCPYYYYNYQGASATYKGLDGITYNANSTNGYAKWNATYYGWNTGTINTTAFPANSVAGGPHVIAGCTPNDYDSTHNWNYSGSNLGNCSNGKFTPGGQASGQQSSTSNNCALIIQDFGPQYYYNDTIKNIVGYPSEYATPVLPDSFINTLDPLTRAIIEPNYLGAQTNNNWPPDSTAHRCYDPSTAYTGVHSPCAAAQSNTACTFNTLSADSTKTPSSVLYDEIENPEAGAVYCNSQTPETYGLYWNDLGSNRGDDLGYWNAINLFTCSIPSTSGEFTGPPSIYD